MIVCIKINEIIFSIFPFFVDWFHSRYITFKNEIFIFEITKATSVFILLNLWLQNNWIYIENTFTLTQAVIPVLKINIFHFYVQIHLIIKQNIYSRNRIIMMVKRHSNANFKQFITSYIICIYTILDLNHRNGEISFYGYLFYNLNFVKILWIFIVNPSNNSTTIILITNCKH